MNRNRLAALLKLQHKKMLSGVLLGLASLFLFQGVASAQSETWTLDPAHSFARFTVRHLKISTVHGGFNKLSGNIQYDPKDVTKTAIQVTIDATSVDTGNDNRDRDLRSDNYFDVAKYPTITFRSKRAVATGDGKMKITGDLTVHGVTKEVVLDAEGPTGPVKEGPATHMGATARTKVMRKDFGVAANNAGDLNIDDEISIVLDIDMVQRKIEAPSEKPLK
jgi:polyisoprenoid-binding protein YceI